MTVRRHPPPPLVHRVLPANFIPPKNPPVAHQTSDHSPRTSADWFPTLKPSPSDLSGHRCGAHQMLTLVAYDITDPKRLHRVAKVCENWGLRVQYSLFECRLESETFDCFWAELSELIDPRTDKLTAFKVCTKCARQIRSHGVQEHYEKVVAYVL